VIRPLLLLGALLAPKLAFGHSVGLSSGNYRVAGQQVEAELVFAETELTGLLAESSGRLLDDVLVRSGPEKCAVIFQGENRIEEDGVQFRAQFRCPESPSALSIELPLLEKLAYGHRHLISVSAGSAPVWRGVLHRGDSTAVVQLSSLEEPGNTTRFLGLISLGVEHILTGLDHLVFLLGLLLIGGSARALIKTVTAFTLGHSLTLACGVLGLWSPSPRWIEPLIALSIAYIGIENLFRRNPDGRWRLTLLFGLVHGFGFAGALQELALSRAELPAALFFFNLGVEMGQLAVLALVLPLIRLAHGWAAFNRYGVPALSAAIVVPGLVWFVLRLATG
jgi:hydrogenase/urease accessory protein HupE